MIQQKCIKSQKNTSIQLIATLIFKQKIGSLHRSIVFRSFPKHFGKADKFSDAFLKFENSVKLHSPEQSTDFNQLRQKFSSKITLEHSAAKKCFKPKARIFKINNFRSSYKTLQALKQSQNLQITIIIRDKLDEKKQTERKGSSCLKRQFKKMII